MEFGEKCISINYSCYHCCWVVCIVGLIFSELFSQYIFAIKNKGQCVPSSLGNKNENRASAVVRMADAVCVFVPVSVC